jgi:hypothetical protein
MIGSLNLSNIEWALATILEIALLICLLRKKLYWSHPLFFTYIACTILQSALGAVVYSVWRTTSVRVWSLIWASQVVVILARSLAIVEIAWRNLSSYAGVWGLAKRFLMVVGASVLAYSLLLSRKQWDLVVVNLDRSVELSIAVVIVTLLLFARHYQLPIRRLDRAMAVGFCLYSCLFVINDSLFERWMDSYTNFWNFLDMLTFIASLLLWIVAVNAETAKEPAEQRVQVPQEMYGQMSPEVNLRLRLLNEQLDRLLRSGNDR